MPVIIKNANYKPLEKNINYTAIENNKKQIMKQNCLNDP